MQYSEQRKIDGVGAYGLVVALLANFGPPLDSSECHSEHFNSITEHDFEAL